MIRKDWEDSDPPACEYCGAMAGVCADFPNCPMGDELKGFPAEGDVKEEKET